MIRPALFIIALVRRWLVLLLLRVLVLFLERCNGLSGARRV
jgi:hypothetical protein